MEYSNEKKISLDENLLVNYLLEELLKRQVINFPTYEKSIKECYPNGKK